MKKMEMMLSGLFNPALAVSNILRRFPIGTFEFRVALDGMKRPNYAYALLYAAKQARNLGIHKISAIEFGVASGNGLIELEKIAEEVTKITKVSIDIFGFDIGTGLPTPSDYRDLPYVFKSGFYKMDVQHLQERLKKTTRLILGDISDRISEFIKQVSLLLGLRPLTWIFTVPRCMP